MSTEIKEADVLPADKKSRTKAIIPREVDLPVVAGPSMEAVLMRAVEQGASVETVERVFGMIERANAAAAEREFNAALTRFQETMPVITKRKKVLNKDKQSTRFMYAPIEDILPIARPHLAENGLSVNTGGRIEKADREHFYVGIAYLKHVAGHTEIREFPVPIVFSEFMSDQQSYAAASTFAERYAVRKVLGIVTAGDDNEGRFTP